MTDTQSTQSTDGVANDQLAGLVSWMEQFYLLVSDRLAVLPDIHANVTDLATRPAPANTTPMVPGAPVGPIDPDISARIDELVEAVGEAITGVHDRVAALAEHGMPAATVTEPAEQFAATLSDLADALETIADRQSDTTVIEGLVGNLRTQVDTVAAGIPSADQVADHVAARLAPEFLALAGNARAIDGLCGTIDRLVGGDRSSTLGERIAEIAENVAAGGTLSKTVDDLTEAVGEALTDIHGRLVALDALDQILAGVEAHAPALAGVSDQVLAVRGRLDDVAVGVARAFAELGPKVDALATADAVDGVGSTVADINAAVTETLPADLASVSSTVDDLVLAIGEALVDINANLRDGKADRARILAKLIDLHDTARADADSIREAVTSSAAALDGTIGEVAIAVADAMAGIESRLDDLADPSHRERVLASLTDLRLALAAQTSTVDATSDTVTGLDSRTESIAADIQRLLEGAPDELARRVDDLIVAVGEMQPTLVDKVTFSDATEQIRSDLASAIDTAREAGEVAATAAKDGTAAVTASLESLAGQIGDIATKVDDSTIADTLTEVKGAVLDAAERAATRGDVEAARSSIDEIAGVLADLIPSLTDREALSRRVDDLIVAVGEMQPTLVDKQTLADAVADLRNDLAAGNVTDRVEDLANKIDALASADTTVDLTAVTSALARLEETATSPTPELAAMVATLSDLVEAIEALKDTPADVDVSAITEMAAALRDEVATSDSVEAVSQKIDALAGSIAELPDQITPVDLAPVITAIETLRADDKGAAVDDALAGRVEELSGLVRDLVGTVDATSAAVGELANKPDTLDVAPIVTQINDLRSALTDRASDGVIREQLDRIEALAAAGDPETREVLAELVDAVASMAANAVRSGADTAAIEALQSRLDGLFDIVGADTTTPVVGEIRGLLDNLPGAIVDQVVAAVTAHLDTKPDTTVDPAAVAQIVTDRVPSDVADKEALNAAVAAIEEHLRSFFVLTEAVGDRLDEITDAVWAGPDSPTMLARITKIEETVMSLRDNRLGATKTDIADLSTQINSIRQSFAAAQPTDHRPDPEVRRRLDEITATLEALAARPTAVSASDPSPAVLDAVRELRDTTSTLSEHLTSPDAPAWAEALSAQMSSLGERLATVQASFASHADQVQAGLRDLAAGSSSDLAQIRATIDALTAEHRASGDQSRAEAQEWFVAIGEAVDVLHSSIRDLTPAQIGDASIDIAQTRARLENLTFDEGDAPFVLAEIRSLVERVTTKVAAIDTRVAGMSFAELLEQVDVRLHAVEQRLDRRHQETDEHIDTLAAYVDTTNTTLATVVAGQATLSGDQARIVDLINGIVSNGTTIHDDLVKFRSEWAEAAGAIDGKVDGLVAAQNDHVERTAGIAGDLGDLSARTQERLDAWQSTVDGLLGGMDAVTRSMTGPEAIKEHLEEQRVGLQGVASELRRIRSQFSPETLTSSFAAEVQSVMDGAAESIKGIVSSLDARSGDVASLAVRLEDRMDALENRIAGTVAEITDSVATWGETVTAKVNESMRLADDLAGQNDDLQAMRRMLLRVLEDVSGVSGAIDGMASKDEAKMVREEVASITKAISGLSRSMGALDQSLVEIRTEIAAGSAPSERQANDLRDHVTDLFGRIEDELGGLSERVDGLNRTVEQRRPRRDRPLQAT